MNELERIKSREQRRKTKIRSRVKGTETVPRISVFKSNKYIYVQIIDDISQKTLLSASSVKDVQGKLCIETSLNLGKFLGESMKKKNIQNAVFDRNGYKFHGIVKALAQGIRDMGIKV